MDLFKTPKAPKPINPQKVANQQLATNVQSGQQQAAFNRVDQNDAFGNKLNYVQTGKDANGNPTYAANQSLGGMGQQYAQGLSGLGNQYFSQAGNVGNLGSNEAFDKAYGYATANLEPRFEQSRAAMENRLRNQGLDPTSEAYKSGMNDLALQQNESRNNLVTGLQSNLFNQGLQQRQQGMNELQPGIQYGNQFINPSYAQVPGVNTINPDIGNLASQQYQGQMNAYNAKVANQGAALGGLAKIGGALLAPATGGLSLGMMGF
jgi:hypothetical protein